MSRKPSPQDETPNPYAESIDAAALKELVSNHYGTRTLLIDKSLAKVLSEYNTGNRSLN